MNANLTSRSGFENSHPRKCYQKRAVGDLPTARLLLDVQLFRGILYL